LRRIFGLIITLFLLLMIGAIVFTMGCPTPESSNDISNDNRFNDKVGIEPGPAPNSGDGISDGSGY
jgi:hypothetical protein